MITFLNCTLKWLEEKSFVFKVNRERYTFLKYATGFMLLSLFALISSFWFIDFFFHIYFPHGKCQSFVDYLRSGLFTGPLSNFIFVYLSFIVLTWQLPYNIYLSIEKSTVADNVICHLLVLQFKQYAHTNFQTDMHCVNVPGIHYRPFWCMLIPLGAKTQTLKRVGGSAQSYSLCNYCLTDW